MRLANKVAVITGGARGIGRGALACALDVSRRESIGALVEYWVDDGDYVVAQTLNVDGSNWMN